MFDSVTYLTKLEQHLKSSMNDDAYGLEVITKFPSSYMYYPVSSSTVALGFKKLEFSSLGSNPAGAMEISIDIHTARDRGLFPHQYLVDMVINALCSFNGFTIAAANVGETDFNRTHSSICTQVVCSVNFGA